jgi:uncharacterized cupredoxin-like copper-binding protein
MRRLFAGLPVVLLLAACGGYGGSSGGSKTTEGSAAGGAVVKTIQISEKEYSLTPGSVTVPKAGTYAFKVTNNGTITHALTIEASGSEGDEVESGHIDPGSSKTIKFTFQAGKHYEMYCPVDGHRAQGMAGTISVGGAAGGATTTKPEGGTTTSGMPGY